MEEVLIKYRGHTLPVLGFNTQQLGIPIILIHGLLYSAYFWMPKQLEFLFGYGPVYSISLPAHTPARAPTDWSGVDERTLVEATAKQIDRLVGEQQQVIILGHSTGGTVALAYALAHPDRVKGVVTLGAATSGKEEGGILGLAQWAVLHLGAPGRGLLYATLWLNSVSLTLHRFLLKDVVADSKKFFQHPESEEFIDRYFPYQRELDRKQMMMFFRDLFRIDLAQRLCSLKTPVLVMCGDKDPFVSHQRTRYLTDCLPNGHMCEIKDCGHWAMFEQPQQYENAIRCFIDSLPPASESALDN